MSFTVTVSVISLKSVDSDRSHDGTLPVWKNYMGLKKFCFLAAAAGVAAVETFVAGACSDHDHAAVVTGRGV